jgi:hypothetical protein
MSDIAPALVAEEADQLKRLLPAMRSGDPNALRHAHRTLSQALARIDDPLSIKAVPHSRWPPRGFTRGELASSYCGWKDRFVAALIVSYGDEVRDPREACTSAVDLVRGRGCSGTRWYVYDRTTRQMYTFAQGELPLPEPIDAPTPPGGHAALLTVELLSATPFEPSLSLRKVAAAIASGSVAVRVLHADTAPLGPVTFAHRRASASSRDRPLLRQPADPDAPTTPPPDGARRHASSAPDARGGAA